MDLDDLHCGRALNEDSVSNFGGTQLGSEGLALRILSLGG